MKKIIEKMAPNAMPNSARWLASVIDLYGITNPAEFLGQVMYETSRLTSFVENMNYSTEALIKKFGRHRISIEDAERYGRNEDHPADQRALANTLYGGKFGRVNLGNVMPNDGWDFRGHGMIQLTGRDAHQKFADHMQEPRIMVEPEIVGTDMYFAAHAAGFFWTVYKNINGITDVSKVTKLVTGSESQAIQSRRQLTDEARKLIDSRKI